MPRFFSYLVIFFYFICLTKYCIGFYIGTDIIVGTVLKGEGSKNWVIVEGERGGGGWGTKFYARKEDKTEKEELMQKWRGCHFFYYFTIQFNCIYIFWSSDFWVSHARFSSSSKSCTKTWYHLYISYLFRKSTKNVDCFI